MPLNNGIPMLHKQPESKEPILKQTWIDNYLTLRKNTEPLDKMVAECQKMSMSPDLRALTKDKELKCIKFVIQLEKQAYLICTNLIADQYNTHNI